ncbi:MAG: hypothetical protein P8Y37_03485, partial [Anaerolineales bacterium]
LFLLTALPIDVPAVTANREIGLFPALIIRTRSGWTYESPDRRTRLISIELVRRYLLCTGAESAIPVGILYVVVLGMS